MIIKANKYMFNNTKHNYSLKLTVLLLVIFMVLPCFSYANYKVNSTTNYNNLPSDKTFLFDQYHSMYTGSSLALSAASLLDDAESYLIPKRLRTNFGVLLCTAIVDLYIGISLDILYREIFGYSFRIKSLGGSVINYELSFFNDILALAKIKATSPKFWPNNALDIPLLIIIAGYEADQILLQEILFKAFKNKGKIGTGTLTLYILNYQSVLGTLLNSREESLDKETGDPALDYLYYINKKHQQPKMHLTHLRWASLIYIPDFLVDLVIYLLLSKEERNNPGIRVFKWSNMAYKPFFTVRLTPFGIAYCMNNYIRHQEKIFLLSFNIGKSPFYTKYYGGIGTKTDGLYTYKNYTLDISTNIWYQPKLLLKDSDLLEDKDYLGAMVGIINQYRLNKYLSLQGAISYKTSGYLEGMIAQNGFIFQTGITMNLY